VAWQKAVHLDGSHVHRDSIGAAPHGAAPISFFGHFGLSGSVLSDASKDPGVIPMLAYEDPASAIENGPYGRLYRAEDPEGHRWMFLERGGSAGP
jgi:hypothetical protein